MKKENNEYFYYSKLYEDTFDATGWKLIFSEMQPIPAYATMIYFKILTESTAARGVLLRSEDRAYTEEQLMALCGIRSSDPEEIKSSWKRAYQMLIDERIIEVHEDGAIEVILADELFGQDSRSARMKRKYRGRVRSLTSGDEQETESGQEEDICPPDVHEEGIVCPPNEGQTDGFVQNRQTPLNEDESSSNPLKSKEKRVKASPVLRPSDAAAEFVEIYPKKTDPEKILKVIEGFSEEELQALLLAAQRTAKDPSKAEQNGRFAMDPVKFARSKPWTEEELEAAADILWGNRASRKLEGGEGDVE